MGSILFFEISPLSLVAYLERINIYFHGKFINVFYILFGNTRSFYCNIYFFQNIFFFLFDTDSSNDVGENTSKSFIYYIIKILLYIIEFHCVILTV